MGSAWHTRGERSKKEWVVYASGLIGLLIIAGIAAAVVVTSKKNGGSGSGSGSSGSGSGAAVVAATPVTAPITARPPPAAGKVAEQSTSTAKPPPPPTPAQPRSPPPLTARPPPTVPTARPPPPVPPAPRPASPPPVVRPPPPPPTTYDPSFTAVATTNNVPPAPGFVPVVVNASYEGTCQLRTDKNWLCNDGMTGAVDATDVSLLRLLGDPTQMEACGFADMSVIANSVVGWAYKSRCGVEAFTIVRACIGIPGSAGAGHWRARIMLWPKAGSPDPSCTPLCIKMRGNQNVLSDFGRHASCNAQTS